MATTLDFIILILYILLVLFIGIKASRKEHLEGYLTNNRKTKLFLLSLANISSLVGAGAIVGVSSAAYTTGISYGLIVLISMIVSAILFIFISKKIKSFGDKHKAYTIGDFFQHRFGRSSQHLFAIFYVLAALIWSGVQFVAISYLLKVLTGIPFEFSLLLAVAVTIIYTSLGGIRSDILTDFFQFWIMLITFIVLLFTFFIKLDGITTITSLPKNYFDPLAFGGLTFLIGGIFLSGLIGISSVSEWQRIYSADSTKTARRSYIITIPGVIFFVITAIISGLIAITFVPGVEPDSAIFTLMNNLLPTGLLGLAYAGMLSVVMSSIDSLLLAGSATILKDIYMPFFHPQMHEHELLNMARYITAIFGIIGAIIALLFQDVVKLTLLAAFTTGCFAIPILAGLFWKRTTTKACIASMLTSLITTYMLFPFLPKIAGIPAFLIGFIVIITVSLLTKHSESENLTL